MKPLIGITGPRHTIVLKNPGLNLLGVAVGDGYAQAVEAAGGIPVIIPYPTSAQAISDLAGRLDGLLLSGGEDPDPVLYGQSPRQGLGTVIRERDDLEIALVHSMMADCKPILGICRGIQLLNVAFHGTLYQDLASHWSGEIQHQQRAARNHRSHALTVAPESRLQRALGGVSSLRCNSFHHQAVDAVGEGLAAAAWDEEGLVEAVEHQQAPFVVGVQWHPENLWREDAAQFGLFQALVTAAAARE